MESKRLCTAFDVDEMALAMSLRAIADGLETGAIGMKEAESMVSASVDDGAVSTRLSLEYVVAHDEAIVDAAMYPLEFDY